MPPWITATLPSREIFLSSRCQFCIRLRLHLSHLGTSLIMFGTSISGALSPSDGERVAERRVRGKRNDHMTPGAWASARFNVGKPIDFRPKLKTEAAPRSA